MTPTREQLELAAKAAGKTIHGFYEEINEDGVLTERAADIGEVDCILWNPVTDKSDSFDLMVALGGGTVVYFQGKAHFYTDDETACAALADHNNDKGLATMAAAFLCAVEIGRAM